MRVMRSAAAVVVWIKGRTSHAMYVLCVFVHKRRGRSSRGVIVVSHPRARRSVSKHRKLDGRASCIKIAGKRYNVTMM